MLVSASCNATKSTGRIGAAPEPVRITQFYASVPNPPLGEKTLICYGVENAVQVQLDPPVDRVWPAAAHCIDFVPKQETTLTLTASRGAKKISRSITVSPGPPAVHIVEVSINKLEVSRGEQVMVCYKVNHAKTVDIHPGQLLNEHDASTGCVTDHPQKNTTYVVKATGAGGDTDTERVTAKVK